MKGLPGVPRMFQQQYTAKDGTKKLTKSWYATVWQNGRKATIPLGADPKAAAKKLREVMADMGGGHDFTRKARLVDLLRWVEDDYRLNGKKSVDRLQARADHLIAFFGANFPAEKMTPGDMTRYAAKRQSLGAAAGSINLDLALLCRGFRLGRLLHGLTHQPAIPRLVVRNARQGFFERAELEACIAQLPDTYKALVWVAHLTGWRAKSELLTRQWKHVDFRAKRLRLDPEETKNRDGREFPLAGELLEILEWQRTRCDEAERRLDRVIPWVFFGQQGDRIRWYYKAWNSATKAAGMPGRLIHDCRRTRVSILERAGVARSVAMRLVGHRTQVMYDRYAITPWDALQEGVARVQEYERTSNTTAKIAVLGGREKK